MTLTDAMIGAAVLWLLFVACGLPRPPGQSTAVERNASAFLATAPMAPANPTLYSTWHQDAPAPWHVTPPRIETEPSPPEVEQRALGTATIPAIGLPQTLSLTEVTIAPGGVLVLENLRGAGTLVLQAGRLELSEQDGDARLTRLPPADAPPPWEDEGAPTLAPGDRIAYEPGATIVLRNQTRQPARLLTASVLVLPALAA